MLPEYSYALLGKLRGFSLYVPQTLYACALTWRRIYFRQTFLLSNCSHCAPFVVAFTHPRVKAPHGGKIEALKRSQWHIATLVNLVKSAPICYRPKRTLLSHRTFLIHKYHKKVGRIYTLIHIATSASRTEAQLEIIAIMWSAHTVGNPLLYVLS